LTAHLAIVEGGLDRLPLAMGLSRRLVSVTRTSIGLSVAYNVAILPLAMAGWLAPVWAAGAMLLSSISVVANPTRLSL